MDREFAEFGPLLVGMRAAFQRGENAMEWARDFLEYGRNELLATQIAYDLQAGSYVTKAKEAPEFRRQWCAQLAGLIRPHLSTGETILEAGSGEATTLSGVASELADLDVRSMGFDISWSRTSVAMGWIKSTQMAARLFVADLFEIPLGDGAVDVVYTSHSVEPNGGREFEALTELFRVARKALVLVEPLYELAGTKAQQRMNRMAYVRGLQDAALRLNGTVIDYRLLDVISNSLNPSGVLVVKKSHAGTGCAALRWECPVTRTELVEERDLFFSPASGLVYPILRGVPVLLGRHAVLASRIELHACS